MNHRVLAGIFGALLILSAIMGIFSTMNYPAAEAFAQEELHTPNQFIPQELEPLPTLTGDWPQSLPDISVLISIGDIYIGYGNSVRIQFQNKTINPSSITSIKCLWAYGKIC